MAVASADLLHIHPETKSVSKKEGLFLRLSRKRRDSGPRSPPPRQLQQTWLFWLESFQIQSHLISLDQLLGYL